MGTTDRTARGTTAVLCARILDAVALLANRNAGNVQWVRSRAIDLRSICNAVFAFRCSTPRTSCDRAAMMPLAHPEQSHAGVTRAPRRQTVMFAVGLLAATIGAYSNSMGGPFLYD